MNVGKLSVAIGVAVLISLVGIAHDKLQSPIYMYVDWVRAYAKRR
ncbi:MAG: hypothetical protein ACK40X_01780 [Armatimonadota bacterium]